MNNCLVKAIAACLLCVSPTALHSLFSSTIQSSKGSAGKHPARTAEQKRNPEDSESRGHFDQAQKLLSEGKFQEAVQEYRLSLENTPDNEAAHFGIAFALTHLGKTTEAIQSYQTALQLNPLLWEADLNWGVILLNQHDFEGSIAHFQTVQKLNPENFQAFFLEGKAQESLGQSSAALTSLLRALPLVKKEQDRADVQVTLGSLYLLQRNWKAAEEQLTLAKASGSRDLQLDRNLAQVYFETEQLDKCVSLVKPLADANPQEVDLQEMMGRILAKKGDTLEAIQYFERAMNQEMETGRRQALILDLIAAYEKADLTTKAMPLVREEAARSNDPNLHFHLGTLCLHQRDFECASRSFLAALKLKPDYIECYSNLGSIFLLEDKYPEAIVALSKFREARPDTPATYFYLGLAYDKLGDVPNAMSNYKKFLELDQGKSDRQDFQATERLKVLRKSRKRH